MGRIKLFAISALVAVTIAVGCGDDNNSPSAPTESTRFEFSFNGLTELDSAYYQAWALIGEYGYSLGKFSINSSGQMMDTTGAAITDNALSYDLSASTVTAMGITIQNFVANTGPGSGSHFMGGSVESGSASLTVAHEAGAGGELGDVTGKFILATPTNGTDSDETSGIWYVDNSTGISNAGLTLPTFTNGWIYEGWVRVDGEFYSTGTFSSVGAADDSARYSADLQAAPGFPGEDFLLNAPAGIAFPVDLRGKYTMITLEPSPDPVVGAPSPFVLLEATIASDAVDHQTYNMANTTAASLPTGTVTLTVE